MHAETSTGARTDVAALRPVADELGALLVADCVTSSDANGHDETLGEFLVEA